MTVPGNDKTEENRDLNPQRHTREQRVVDVGNQKRLSKKNEEHQTDDAGRPI